MSDARSVKLGLACLYRVFINPGSSGRIQRRRHRDFATGAELVTARRFVGYFC